MLKRKIHLQPKCGLSQIQTPNGAPRLGPTFALTTKRAYWNLQVSLLSLEANESMQLVETLCGELIESGNVFQLPKYGTGNRTLKKGTTDHDLSSSIDVTEKVSNGPGDIGNRCRSCNTGEEIEDKEHREVDSKGGTL
jgi:hypothetical protein